MIGNPRRGNLVSQHIEVARVYKEMLGVDDAIAYLQRANIPLNVAEQALNAAQQSRQPAAPEAAPERPAVCRRKNRVHDAIVEAALKIERKLGTDWALDLLKKENVPDAVAARIAAAGPRQVRARKPGP